MRLCTCQNCAYFVPDIDNKGSCRRFPPMPMGPMLSRFPNVHETSFCGCWASEVPKQADTSALSEADWAAIQAMTAAKPAPNPDAPKRGRPRKGS
jgi:hypothetical protein